MSPTYTDKAKLTIFRAKHEADATGSQEINSAHILLGLLKDATLTEQVLKGVRLQQLREELLARQSKHARRLGSGDLPFSQEAKQALASALEQADKLGSRYVSNGHIWLGLVQAETTDVTQILRQSGLTIETLRPQIEALILKENAEIESRLAQTTRIQGANNPTPTHMVLDVAEREGDRQALKLIEGLLADPDRDRATTLRELWFTATVLAAGDLQLIRHYCQELLAYDPDDPMALYVLADCAERQGHPDEARRYAAKSYANLIRSSSTALPDLIRSRWPEITREKGKP